MVAGHDPVDDLGGVDGVQLVEEIQCGEAPVGAVEPDVLHHQRLERVLLREKGGRWRSRRNPGDGGREDEIDGWMGALPSPR